MVCERAPTCGGIASEGNAAAGIVIHVAVHHTLHGDGRAEVPRDVVNVTVRDGAEDRWG